jgi:hypothetical protein
MNAETQIASRNSGKLRGAPSEVRPEKVREKQYEPYRPRGLQDVPAALQSKLENEGWHVHWVRIMLEGEVDTENLADIAHKGYEPVDVKEVPENILRTLQISDVAGFKGLIVSKDTALFKISTERYQEIRQYYRDIADSQLRGVNETIRQNASMHGITVELYDESKSQVAVGKDSRKVQVQED